MINFYNKSEGGANSHNALSFNICNKLKVSSVLLSILVANTVNAGLTTATAYSIQGSAPYLTYDGGVTKATTTDELLWIKLSDGTLYTKLDNTSTASNPIMLPVEGQTIANIEMLIPESTVITSATDLTQTIGLDALMKDPYNYWADDDDDGNISATGSLSVMIKDALGRQIERSDILTNCFSPYQVTLTSTAGVLSTQYGIPNSSSFTEATTTYYIAPKSDAPYACHAQPNLTSHGGSYDGPSDQWDATKGFKLQDITDPASNFPTTGAKGFYFNLLLESAISNTVTYTKTPSTSPLGLTLTQSYNGVKVELTGPGDGSTKAQAMAFTPTEFTLKAGNTVLYTFKIQTWFIAKRNDPISYSTAQTYCTDLGYSLPTIANYTNANGDGWNDGLSGQDNRYQRRIAGGLFAEWGSASFTYYTNIDFESTLYFWSSQSKNNTNNQYIVFSNDGRIFDMSQANGNAKVSCINN